MHPRFNLHIKQVGSVLILLALVGLSTGCAGYRLGSMLPPDIRTVSVPTFDNQTTEPLLEVETTRRSINMIQRDGSLLLVPREEADSELLVTLTEFDMQPLAFDRNRRAAAEEYRIFITASIQLIRLSTGDVIAAHPRVRGESTFEVVGDLTSAKLTAIPAAADDLAQQIISTLVETW